MQRQPLSNGTAAPEVFGAGDGGAELSLPPGFELIALREGGDAFAYAQEIAAQRGAGTLVFVQRFDLVEFAVVLEPDEPLATARRAFYAGMCAMADSLAVHCPPEKPIHFDWPDTMFFDHGVIGGGKLAWPKDAAEDQPPEWLVFAGMMRTAVIRNRDSDVSLEPGTWAVGTALEVEGFDEINHGVLVESFCRHLMVHVDAWAEKGFRRVGREWLARLPEDKTLKRGIDGNGDLLVHQAGIEGEPVRHPLVATLAECRWFDAQTREPKL
ncbi:MAG: biotin/lipoate--protein ligase family protein [Beijerinckiaceae bacterium]